MKKIIVVILAIFMIVGCAKDNNNIPLKKNSTDNASLNSPINSHNLDKYMNRSDVQYVDLRSSKMVLEEGYVSGFEFIPFYNIIASFSGDSTLYKMERTTDEEGNNIYAGQIGSFKALYEESQSIIESLFSKDKYIFLISQGGSESSYLINLLIQLGYNGNLLYNVGGVSNGEGVDSYRDVVTNKYYVEGHQGFNASVSYDFLSDLTPIE